MVLALLPTQLTRFPSCSLCSSIPSLLEAPGHAALRPANADPGASEEASSVRPLLRTLLRSVAPDSRSPTPWLLSFPSKPWGPGKRQDPGHALMGMNQLSPTKGASVQQAGGAARVPDMPTSALGDLSCRMWFCRWTWTRRRQTETSEPKSYHQHLRSGCPDRRPAQATLPLCQMSVLGGRRVWDGQLPVP